MLRITELKLPLDHVEAALPAALIARLGIKPDDLIRFTVFRRGYDSRKKADIQLVYTLDVELPPALEAALFKRFRKDANVVPTPDTGYKFVLPMAADATFNSLPFKGRAGVGMGFAPSAQSRSAIHSPPNPIPHLASPLKGGGTYGLLQSHQCKSLPINSPPA